MTVEFLSRFAQFWEEIFKNGLRKRVPHEFAYLGKLLAFAEIVNHVIVRLLLPVSLKSSQRHLYTPEQVDMGTKRIFIAF